MSVPSAAPSGILEQQAIREKCVHPSGVFTEFSREDLQQTVASLFERQVRKSPLRLAIQTPVQALTYEQLNAQANRLARGILSQAPHPGERVVLLLEKSATAIAALLATLKTGNISVTVEPSYTRERLRQIVSYAEAGVIVSSAGHWDLARELQGEFPRATLVNADELGANLSSTNLDLPASITLYAGGLYFTSGSTGEPKALLETRELLLYNIRTYTNDLHLTPEDRLSLVHSLTFTACHRNLFGALLNGGCLLPFDPGKEGLNQFGAWLSREAITILHCPASLFRHLEGAVPGDLQFPSVRVIYAANEPVSRTEVEFYRKRFSSRCIFVNGLGSSEVSTVCRYFVDKNTLLPCERGLSGTSEVPVGYSPEDVGLILRDEDGRQIEGEGSGELYVRSRLKIHGYWRRPDLTQATFLKDPEDSGAILYRSGDRAERFADGSITLLGREDYMLKISGRMVDPAAVERTLLGHLGVREACVTAKVGSKDLLTIA